MNSVTRNIGHNAIAKILMVGVQFATTTILARTLSAADYGIVGFANVIMAFFLRIGSMSLNSALIQAPLINEKVLDTAAALNALLAVIAFLCVQVCAPLAGFLLGSPASVTVVRVLAFGFLFAPLGFLPSCLLTREMQFARLRTPSIIGTLVRGIVAVILALTGWKYWSLVWGNLSGNITGNGILHFIRPVYSRWYIDRVEAIRLLRVGIPLTLSSFLVFAVLNLDNLVIGSTLGSTMLGYYSVAFNWATFGCTGLQEIVHSVLFPKFARLQANVAHMHTIFLRTVRLVGFGAVLLNLSLLLTAGPFLVHILGKGTDRWLPAQGTLQILCLYGAIRAVTETVANPILGLGESRVLLKANAVAAFLEIAFLPFVARWGGIVGVATWIIVAYSSQCLFFIPFLSRRLGVRLGQLLKIVSPIGFSAVITGVFVRFIPLNIHVWWIEMSLRLAIVVSSYTAIHEVISRGAIWSELQSLLAKRR